MCHKSAQKDNMDKANTDTVYNTCYNDQAILNNNKVAFQCKHDFHEIWKGYGYDMTKFFQKEETYIVVDKDR